jgi:hypothetical protein
MGAASQFLVDALEAVDEFLREGLAGLGPEEAAGDAAVLLYGEGEGQQHLDVFLDVAGGGLVELGVFADVAVLVEAGVVELGAEAEDADGGGLLLPGGIEAAGFFGGFVEDRGPELPLHLELVGHVVVELLGGFGDGGFDEGVGGLLGALVVDVDALVDGGLGEAEGVGRGDGDALVSADERELAHDADERFGQRGEAEVRIPETEIKLIGHAAMYVLSGCDRETFSGYPFPRGKVPKVFHSNRLSPIKSSGGTETETPGVRPGSSIGLESILPAGVKEIGMRAQGLGIKDGCAGRGGG